ncbi:cell wall metabolism sensor histidine kinase WalK [Mucilaginibacter sp. SG564]|uniref:sensor histidine kinase n=1 Tax=unclassified Mucilaginibacter TaxID=2617802 RepID=UPI0015567095|nr:ATP-binding protein [Mucilaginibacter sp. SG564]NOW97722.1 PAS domain S-box-containing protein [Mucilaginibacter sp. SG564]
MKNKDQNIAAKQHIDDLIIQAPVAIGFLKGPDLIIESANTNILELWEKQTDIIGWPLALILKPDDVKLVWDAYKSGHIHYGYETPIWLNRNGHINLFYFDFVYQPVKDNDNNIIGVMVVATEVTKQVIARQLLEDAEERLRLAIEATGIGNWDLDLVNNDVIASPTLSVIFGLDPDESVTHMELRGMIHPDDKSLVNDAYKKAIKAGVYSYEARIVWTDGSIHWIRTTGKILYDALHKPVRMLGTTHDITKRKQEEIMKNDFIAMASHELKTPLTSLKAYTQLLVSKAQKAGDDFFISALEKSENQINKMSRLIHGFLDMSKIESGKLKLNIQSFDMNELVVEIMADKVLIAPDHVLSFKSKQSIQITADREKIAQVISNFISNAVKYSPKGSAITIVVKKHNEDLKVSVKDAGIGLKKSDQQTVFQRFYRVEDESTRGLSGFGIGLYLSAEIIRLHHGKIAVESEEGKGSEFYFLLPLETGEGQPA